MLVFLCNSTCKLCIGLLYCPPSSPASVFETLYSHLLEINVNSFSTFVLLGDFNEDHNNSSHLLFANLYTTLLVVFHLPMLFLVIPIFSPSGAGSLIDLALITCQSSLTN